MTDVAENIRDSRKVAIQAASRVIAGVVASPRMTIDGNTGLQWAVTPDEIVTMAKRFERYIREGE